MKYISMELTRKSLSFMLCDTSKGFSVGEPVTVVLPKNISGNVLNPPAQTADFIAALLREQGLRSYPLTLMLDMDQIINIVFPHVPAKPDKLRGLANLYAQSSLPQSSGEYYIAFNQREYIHTDGQNRSTLFAASAELIRKFYIAMRKAGVMVYTIETSSAAFSRAVLSLASFQTETSLTADIYIDFGETSSLATVCHNKQIVFEQAFSSIYQDVIDTYMNITEGTVEEAREFFSTVGINPDAEIYTRFPDLLRRMNILVDVTLDEIMRTLRIVFSSERLETGLLYISGTFTYMPGFVEKVANDSISFVGPDNVRVGKNTRLTGGLPPKINTTENLLFTYNAQQKRLTSTAVLGCVLVVLIACIFPIQLVLYNNQKSELEKLQTVLTGGDYAEVQSLLTEKERLLNLKGSIADALKQMPAEQQSKAREILQTLYNQFSPYCTAISVELDNTTGAISVQFTAFNYDNYIAMKAGIEAADYFSVDPTFSCTIDLTTGQCSGTVNMNINNFVPYTVLTTSSEEVTP